MKVRNTMFALLDRYRGRSLLRKVAENAGWQMTDKVLRAVVGLLVGVWVARYLGPKGFGSLNFAIAFTAIFQPATDLGLQAVVIRDLVRSPHRRREILGSAIVLRLLGAAVSIVLIAVCALLSRPGDMVSLGIDVAVALSFVAQAWDIIDYDYQSRMRPRPIVITRLVSLLAFAAVKVMLIMMRAPVIWFALTVSGEAAMSAVVFRRLAASAPGGLHLSAATRAEIADLLRASWPLAISALSVILYMRIDQVMLGEMLGDRAVGVFSAAVRISESWFFVPMAVVAAAAPALTAAHQSSESAYRRQLLAVVRALYWLGLAAAVLLSFSSHAVIQFLYGDGYREAGSVLAVHAWAGVFASLGLASGPWFVNAGLLRLRMVYTMIGAVVNCMLNLYAIPHYGVVGAAVSTLVSYGAAGFLLNACNRNSRPMFGMQLRSLTFR
jgi:PST family polysaccharide transporter